MWTGLIIKCPGRDYRLIGNFCCSLDVDMVLEKIGSNAPSWGQMAHTMIPHTPEILQIALYVHSYWHSRGKTTT